MNLASIVKKIMIIALFLPWITALGATPDNNQLVARGEFHRYYRHPGYYNYHPGYQAERRAWNGYENGYYNGQYQQQPNVQIYQQPPTTGQPGTQQSTTQGTQQQTTQRTTQNTQQPTVQGQTK